MRQLSEQELIHERLGDRFLESLSDYDTQRRVAVLVDDFLGESAVKGCQVLDVGCGYGFFSQRVKELGGHVTACDLSEQLVQETISRVGCAGRRADALHLEDTFGENQFDVVVSSECIEHTPDPSRAVQQFVKVCRPGGMICVSTPNYLWWPVVMAATKLRLRPFDGLENFSSFGSVRRSLDGAGADVIAEKGLHLFPFQLPLHGISSWCDGRLQVFKPLMINLCVKARKRRGD